MAVSRRAGVTQMQRPRRLATFTTPVRAEIWTGSARVSAVNVRSRITFAVGLATIALLALAPAALAADGVGLGGRTTDKSVTFFCFGVIALFIALPIVLSLIQAKLEGRKERMREQLERVRRP